MASPNVPKFGNWENEEDVPYTAYFEKARKTRTSAGNNPQEEPSALGEATGSSSSGSNKRQGKSASHNNSYEKSPLRDATKNSSDGIGRSKPRSNIPKADDSPEKGAVVPKFGDWDENNPSSADGYTHIFNKVREERTSSSNVTGSRTPTHSSTRKPSDRTKFCCFSWGAK